MIFIPRLSKYCGYCALLAAGAATPLWALAETEAPAVPGVSTSAMLQTGFGLLFVFGLLFLAAYLLHKFNPTRGFGKNGPLRVISGLMISNRERIVLLEVGDTWLVVGVVPGQIRTLYSMPKGEMPPSATDQKPFGQWLQQMIERKNETR